MSDATTDPIVASRAHLYRLLSAVLADPPDAAAVAELADGGLVEEVDPPDPASERALGAIANWAEGVEDHEREAERLTREHTRLFVGPKPALQIHESYYAEDYLGEPLAAVKGSYGALGIAPGEELREEADHAAVELAALAVLFERGDREDVRFFLAEHGWWFERLATDVREAASGPFYAAVADALDALVRDDLERFDAGAGS